MKKILATVVFTLALVSLVRSNLVLDALADNEFKRELDDELMEKREAAEFFKRSFFHPFSTKNEEIKRETREVYEEKCESIIPMQRFCPDIKRW